MEMTSGKRKGPSAESNGSGPQTKKKKGGNAGKWKTTNQMTHKQHAAAMDGTIEPGDAGVWATCARSMEGRAARELRELFDEYAESMYGVKRPDDTGSTNVAKDEEQEKGGDIEASIQRELESMKKPAFRKEPGALTGPPPIFAEVRVNVSCLVFMKTRAPVDPVELVLRICRDAAICEEPRSRKARYLNRLTPVSSTGKVTDQGIEAVARKVLSPWFTLRDGTTTGDDKQTSDEKKDGEDEGTDEKIVTPYSYAIRPTIRNNGSIHRDVLIKKLADLIDTRHKVNLGSPDKTIFIEVYQNICGMSVMEGGDWERLKKYNLTELYSQSIKSNVRVPSQKGGEEKPK